MSSGTSTPLFLPTPSRTPLGGSRKGSAIGGGLMGATDEERKMAPLSSKSLLPPARAPRGSLSRSYGLTSDETAPLTGDLESAGPQQTPLGTPSSATLYGSARLRVDAAEWQSRKPYLARCAMCKELITSNKSLAYHAAGCQLKSFHAFSFASRWMQGLRGARSSQGDQSSTEGEQGASALSIACFVAVLSLYNLALAGGINFQQATGATADWHWDDAGADGDWARQLAHLALFALVLLCFSAFYGFSLGLLLALHRLTLRSVRAWAAMLCYAASLPLALAINWVLSVHWAASEPTTRPSYGVYLLVCHCACVGLLIYCSFVDVVLEEWARREARWAKSLAFVTGAALVCAGAAWTI